ARASCRAETSSSRRRIRCAVSDIASAMVSAAITVSRVSPISPNFLRKPSMRMSRSRASSMRWASWPSSQAMRNCRPLMVTLTWDIPPPPTHTRLSSRRRLHGRSAIGPQRAADGFDGLIDALRHVAIGGLERAGAGGGLVELAGQPGAVVVERMDLVGERLRAAVGLAAALRRLVQRLQRQAQTAACSFDRIGIAHAPIRLPHRAQKLCDRNHLRKEAYVASSLSVNA